MKDTVEITTIDCIKGMKQLDENSIDSVVTDPPYGLGFMGKEWDTFDKDQFGVAGEEGKEDLKIKKNFKILPRYKTSGLYDFTLVWSQEALRVLKPGGHLLSFGGSRTYHRMACAIEDAGFEIRDQMMWIYGNGFPKSLNVGKAVDKRAGKYVDIKKFQKWLKIAKIKSGVTNHQLDKALGFSTKGGGMFDHFINPSQAQLPRAKTYRKIKEILQLDDTYDDIIEGKEREIIGKKKTNLTVLKNIGKDNISGYVDITAPATLEAQQWEGWGTALKPSHEPIVLARKPLSEPTVAQNVLKWGTAGINIDECRIGNEVLKEHKSGNIPNDRGEWGLKKGYVMPERQGRFPANIILDEGAGKMLDEQSGISKSKKQLMGTGIDNVKEEYTFSIKNIKSIRGHNDKGGASRFFYCAKASKEERNEGLDGSVTKLTNLHPTVKPIALMQYLIRLVTPPGGIVLDPFVGSGTTGIASYLENKQFIGFEKEQEYSDIAQARINYYKKQKKLTYYKKQKKLGVEE